MCKYIFTIYTHSSYTLILIYMIFIFCKLDARPTNLGLLNMIWHYNRDFWKPLNHNSCISECTLLFRKASFLHIHLTYLEVQK